MKSKKLIAIVATAIMIFTVIIGVALKVHADAPDSNTEGLLIFNDKELYMAIVKILDDMNVDFNDYSGFNYFNDDCGYIKMNPNDIAKIKTLDISEKGIENLNGIQGFTELENLQAEDNKITDISALAANTKITVLNLNNNELTNSEVYEDDKLVNSGIEVLTNLTNLTNLGIANNRLSEVGVISDLADLEGLIELRIGGIDYTTQQENFDITADLNKLSALTKLKVLSVSGIKLKPVSQTEEPTLDISFIESMNQLEELDISFNNIKDLQNLSKETKERLSNVQILNLYGNALDDDDIGTIKTMANLISLNMGSNAFTKVGDLKKLTNLEFLNLKGNELVTIDGIEELTNLKELYIEENKLEAIDNSKVANIENVYFAKQNISRSVEGLYGQTKTIPLPHIFEQAKAWVLDNTECNENNYVEKYLELSNCELSEDGKSIEVDPFNVANSGGYIKILKGFTEDDENQDQDKVANIYEGTILNIYGTSILYEEDITTDEMIIELLTALQNAETTLDDFDMDKFEDYFKEVKDGGILDKNDPLYEVIDKYMDFNLDGKIDYEDYNRLYAYKMGNIDFLYTAFTTLSHKVNNDIIAQIITTDKNVELNLEDSVYGSIHRFTKNEGKNLAFVKDNNLITLSATVDKIDKVAPVAGTPVYSTTEQNVESVTVTITANEDIENIYNFEENETQANEEDDENLDSGWSLGEDNRTITKVFRENAEEIVPIQDKAGNITTVTVIVNSITETVIDSDGNNEG